MKMEAMAGYCPLMADFVPENSPYRCLVESVLWTLHAEGICCAVSGLFPTHQTVMFKQVLFTGLYFVISETPESDTVITAWYQL